MKEQRARMGGREIAFFIINIVLAVGALVPFVVDVLIHGRMTWSIIVLAAIAMAWLVIAPWFVLRSNRFVWSWAAAVMSVPGLLIVIETVTPAKGWFLALGLPAAIVGLAGAGAIGWLWIYGNLKALYAVSITHFVIAAVSFGELSVVRSFVQSDPVAWVRYLVAYCLLGVAVVLGVIALSVHGFKPFRAVAHE